MGRRNATLNIGRLYLNMHVEIRLLHDALIRTGLLEITYEWGGGQEISMEKLLF